MKLCTFTIIAAFSCLAVVSAAPSSLVDLPIEYGWEPGDLPWAKWYQCLINLLGDISKAEGEGEAWAKYQPKLQGHVDAWKKCDKAGSKEDFDSSNQKEGQATYAVMEEYMKLMIEKNRQVIKEFVAKQGKCYEEKEELVGIDTFGWEMPKDFPWAEFLQCYVDFLGKVSEKYDLGELWQPYRSQVQIHLDEWTECAKAGSEEAIENCNELEGMATYKLLDEYLRTMFSVNEIAYQEFMRGFSDQCIDVVG